MAKPEAQDFEEESSSSSKGGTTTYNSVKMDDGRTVDFAGKRKMLKESIKKADGSLQVRLDFVNGETRLFTISDALLAEFALHGAQQKLGDEIAGLTDVEDAIIAIDELTERLNAGTWGVQRAAGGAMAGTSILARALVEHTGKSMETIKAFLSPKSAAEKVALRRHKDVSVIVARLEAEKAAKGGKTKSTVDTDALLGEIV